MRTDPEFVPFSHAGLDPAGRRNLRAKLIIHAAKVCTASFLRRRGEEVERASSGLIDVLSAWCQSDATIDEAMRFPLALRTLSQSELDPVWIAALSAAHLNTLGRDGDWQVSFVQPASLAFGICATPPAQRISVSARAGRVEVCLDGSARIQADRLPTCFYTVDLGCARVFILTPQTQSTFPVDDAAGFADVPIPKITGTLAEAASVLGSFAPDYLGWVEDALSAVVPVPRPAADAAQSFSVQGLNGIIFASFPSPALKMAELLVHECSHQYFHYGQLDTLFSNGMDTALYWSPYVQKDRLIGRILITFHAFANIVLFYRACLLAGIKPSRELEGTIAFHLHNLGPMSGYLECSPGLSPAGHALFEPLREELFR